MAQMNAQEEVLSKVLVTGANGMVGSYVDFGIKLDKQELDITDLNNTVSVCKKYNPKVILHLAAATDVVRCEKEPEYSYLVNSIGTYNMVVAAKEIGAKFVYVSTSAVFNGFKKEPYKEDDEVDPKEYYGRSKLIGELVVKGILKDYIIARACWMFGGGPKKDHKFFAKILEQMGQKEINVVSGMYGSPTYGKDLVSALKKLITDDEKGIFHVANSGSTSRVDIAKEIVKITNSKTVINEVDPNFFSDGHKGDNYKNQSMISKVSLMRPWQEALKDYIESEWPSYINK